MNYLLLLEDLDRCSRLSWGSAVLACLYRNLCKASLSDVNIIAGPLMLLQLWAPYRIPATEPTFDGQINDVPYDVRYILYFLYKLNKCVYIIFFIKIIFYLHVFM